MTKPVAVENTTRYHALQITDENAMTLRAWFDSGQQEYRSRSIEKIPDLQGYWVIRDPQGILAIVDPGAYASEWEEVDASHEDALFAELTTGDLANALGSMETVEEYQVTGVPDEDGPVWLDMPTAEDAKAWTKKAMENGLEGRLRVRTVITVARSWKEIPA
jgi:hypothetical protein